MKSREREKKTRSSERGGKERREKEREEKRKIIRENREEKGFTYAFKGR